MSQFLRRTSDIKKKIKPANFVLLSPLSPSNYFGEEDIAQLFHVSDTMHPFKRDNSLFLLHSQWVQKGKYLESLQRKCKLAFLSILQN